MAGNEWANYDTWMDAVGQETATAWSCLIEGVELNQDCHCCNSVKWNSILMCYIVYKLHKIVDIYYWYAWLSV